MSTRLTFLPAAFAVATEVDPDILILDEILAVGDAAFQQKCFARIENFRRAGKTILFVSHNMNQITEYCDRVIMLDRGKIVIDGSAAEVVETYKHLTVPELATAG